MLFQAERETSPNWGGFGARGARKARNRKPRAPGSPVSWCGAAGGAAGGAARQERKAENATCEWTPSEEQSVTSIGASFTRRYFANSGEDGTRRN